MKKINFVKDHSEALALLDRLLVYACLLPRDPNKHGGGDMPQLLSCLRRAKNLLGASMDDDDGDPKL